MKSFQAKADATPPDVEWPGDPPLRKLPHETAPSEREFPAETHPLPRNTKPHHNAEVDFKGEALERHACLNH